MKAVVAALLALLLGAGVASAAKPPADPYYTTIDGVSYFAASGHAQGSAAMAKDGSGERRLDFVGCAFVQLRPGNENGRIQVLGLLDNYTPMAAEVGDFAGDGARQGGVATNLTLRDDLDHALPHGAAVPAEAAAWGTATMSAGLVFDPAKNTFVFANFTDPVGGGEELRATFALLKDGVRDNATGALLGKPDKGRTEMHVVLESPDGAAPTPDHASYAGPSDLPDGSMSADAEHAALYPMLDTRFGGEADVTITATSKAAPGLNQLTMHVLRPDGSDAGNVSVASSFLGPGKQTLKVRLDQMGQYQIAVTGKLLMGSYGIDAVLQPAPAFRLDAWWGNLTAGASSGSAQTACAKEIGAIATVRPVVVGRHRPTLFPFEVMVLAAVGILMTVLMATKFVAHTRAESDFKRQFRR